MLRPGHPSPSFRWSCQRQRGDSNRPGTLDRSSTWPRVFCRPFPPRKGTGGKRRLSGPCHERAPARGRPGPRSLPTRDPQAGTPIVNNYAPSFMRPDHLRPPLDPFNFSVRYPGAPPPFVRDGVVMLLRDSCTSALSPALLSQARGSISSRTQAAGASAATRIITCRCSSSPAGAPPVIAAACLSALAGGGVPEGPAAGALTCLIFCCYSNYSKIEFDAAERQAIIDNRGLDMAGAAEIFEGATLTIADERKNYGEPRFITIGRLDGRMVVSVWTPRGHGKSKVAAASSA